MSNYNRMERRCGKDRRKQRLSIFKWVFYNGARKSVRRAEERQRIVIFDQYKPSLFVATILVLSLSLLDALLTLILLSQGAEEINPIMRYFLTHGPQTFILVKYGLTVVSVLIIVLASEALSARHRLFNGIIPLFASLFGGVVIWQLYLLSVN